ncbi:MAG: hypothetical protein K1X89_06305 [Myxococcaceae bacterium]|nr:hypothetical protein [Myxococcaceae bacterium]
MSARTPRELEELRQRLLTAARAERPDADRARARRDAVLDGTAAPTDLEPPPFPAGSRRWRRAAAVALGALALLLAWWLLTRGEAPATVRPGPVVPEVPSQPMAPVDAGAALALADPAVEPDAAAEAGPAPAAPAPLDAGTATRPRRPASPPAEDPDLLAKELALLDEARGHLKADPKATLATLARHAREFPRGALRGEAELVKLEALLALGQQQEAQRLAARLIAADREGLVRERVKRLLARPPQ